MLDDFIKAASGKKPADLLLKGGRVVNVLSGEIIRTDVAVYKGRICGFGSYEAKETIDIEDRYLLPGYIDGHIHIESSLLTVSEFANTVVPLGTTSIVADPHEIANVLGLAGIKYILATAKYQPLEVYLMMPSCVPATNLETSGAVISAGDIFPYLSEKWVVGLGEMMNFTGVVNGQKDVLDKIKMVSSKKIDGHAPGLSGKALSAYISAGISSDHESISYDEAAEKLRKGMHIMIREGTATKNLNDLIGLVKPSNSSNFSFVSDDRSPEDLISRGHINYIVKKAIKSGLDPVIAVKLASLNTARYFNLEGKGAIAPGYDADLQVLKSFRSPRPIMVFKKGRLVAENGELKKRRVKPKDVHIRGSINVKWLVEDDFKVKARGKKVKTIKIVPSQIVTEYKKYKTPASGGLLVSDTSRDMLKICVVERHRASGNIGIGMLRGMGLKSGAIATSVAHDSHNIVVTGVNDSEIMAAVIQVIKMGGGLAVVKDGEVLESLDLPIAGLMSERPIEEVKDKLISLKNKAKELGAIPDDPFFTLSFLCLPVIPELKITDKGLVDVNKFKIVGLFN
ncbi:MAG: adenine deaminase [Elusimicrobiota bacterium]|nr:adenine deaminase [Elusimicrobiota bacterium]